MSGCGKHTVARGFCKSHYRRFMDHGDPLAGQAAKGAPVAWLVEHIDHSDPECLTWPFGRKGDGRGGMRYEGRPAYAHRIMCEMAHGPAPTLEHEVAHSCGRGHKGCVNPAHLRWATRSENCGDRTLHGTQNRGERCGNARLSAGDVRTIRSLQGTRSQKSLAVEYAVTKTTIYAIHKRKLWGWLA